MIRLIVIGLMIVSCGTNNKISTDGTTAVQVSGSTQHTQTLEVTIYEQQTAFCKEMAEAGRNIGKDYNEELYLCMKAFNSIAGDIISSFESGE